MLNRTFPLAATFSRAFHAASSEKSLNMSPLCEAFFPSRQELSKNSHCLRQTPSYLIIKSAETAKCNRDNVVIFYGLPHRQLRNIFGLEIFHKSQREMASFECRESNCTPRNPKQHAAPVGEGSGEKPAVNYGAGSTFAT